MVHRAPDSRLLANLIVHEKEYTKHLAALFPLSHSALASLSAYAAASPSYPSSPAQSIAAVVNALAGADNALQRYNQATEAWREQLVSLKDLEDDLAAVLRDRDILVTRLIKASKSTRDVHRSSRLITPLTGLGSVSLSSLPSSNSTTTASGSGSGPASTNSKLAQAQAELQACEAHLVTKECELDARRISIAHQGLGARCRALVSCGWVWGEMGKQGLKALQALSVNGVASSGHMAVPPPLSLNTAYASDSSSLTPSQSAHGAAQSLETNHSEHTTEPEAKLPARFKPNQVRTTGIEEEGDVTLTLTLPPAHAIPELAFPTGIRSQPTKNGDLVGQKQSTLNINLAPTPTPRRKRGKRPHRPPSQHITEVSDEGSDRPSSASNHNASANATTNGNPDLSVPRTTFLTTCAAPGTHDTSSEDDHRIGPLEVVENDPFEMIRRSMLGPSASAVFFPTAASALSVHPSVPDTRGDETSPSKSALPSSGSGPGMAPGADPVKRERRTSMAFFGSIRGLFRKPKDRDRVGVEWDMDHSSPSPSSPSRTKGKGSGRGAGGWVTRTDARIKGSRGGEEGSDAEATLAPMGILKTTPVADMARRGSGARLRKGRPGASSRGAHENGSSPIIPVIPSHRVDGWITDSETGPGGGSGVSPSTNWGVGTGTGTGTAHKRSRTRRGTTRRKKTSVADLRGSDQGHTDGEVHDSGLSGRRSSEQVFRTTPEVLEPDVDVEEERKLARRGSTSKSVLTNTDPTADPNINPDVSPSTHHRRAATTTATSTRKPLPDGAPTHRRSASLSLMHTRTTSVSTSTQGIDTLPSTGGAMSCRKSPLKVESPPQAESQSESQTASQMLSRAQTELLPKQNARRHVSNGHAVHTYKHTQSQSLMSIVANVTRQNEDEDEGRDRVWVGMGVETDKTKSLDIPRAPGSVLRDVDRDRELPNAGKGVNGRGHARTSSSPTAMNEGERGRGGGGGQLGHPQGQGQGRQRLAKLPLRSALRNASRTPSPSPVSVAVPTPMTVASTIPVANDLEAVTERVVQVGVQPAQVEEDRGREVPPSQLRDSASISSYETTRESFEEDGVSSLPLLLHSNSQSSPLRSQLHNPAPRSQSPTPHSHTPPLPPLSFTFPPPPVDPPPASVAVTVRGEMTYPTTTEQPSSSNVSTETPPVRRKSVRVSLQPTFSPTPPVLYDEDGEDYAPWSRSFSMRSGAGGTEEKERERERKARDREERNTRKGLKGSGDGQEDMWADSSEEDEVYSRAKQLLHLAGKQDKAKEESKAKGKARAKDLIRG